ncbi:alpha/beta hydrolase [[Actinomadura] parvosata]|uniref:alpha/beta hydrolase n=1 Tax=[Actinomadura] parvosata TaxID=1955412 RepID=UPI0009ACCC99|nr:alpha/beta fold hydrolase [Nonomuraea sp. ATCC 55076]
MNHALLALLLTLPPAPAPAPASAFTPSLPPALTSASAPALTSGSAPAFASALTRTSASAFAPAPTPTSASASAPVPTPTSASASAPALIPTSASAFTPLPISWRPCGERQQAECGSVEVPLDWDAPAGRTIKLSVARRKATGERIGTLFFNPGGPGGQAAMLVRDYPQYAVSAELLRRFDVVGIDPRGVGESTPVTCDRPVHDPSVTQFPETRPDYRELVAHNRAVGLSCLAATGPLLREIDTTSVARDFDAVRAALGEPKISFLGKSYGTMLGTEYARLFPGRVRTMALDGAVDHSMDSNRLVTDAAVAVEDSFAQFVRWCAGTTACTLHGRDVARLWDDLLLRAEREPIPVKGGRPLTGEELRYVTYVFLNQLPEYSNGLANALVQAEQGDAQILASMRASALDDAASTSAYRSILCLDIEPGVTGYRDLRARLDRVRRLAPHMKGTSEFWDMTAGCLGWPIRPTNPQRPLHVRGVPPVLVVGNTHDPATPLSWARSLSSHIDGSGLLVNDENDGNGHSAYLRTSCATSRIDDYLTSGTLPPSGTVCR